MADDQVLASYDEANKAATVYVSKLAHHHHGCHRRCAAGFGPVCNGSYTQALPATCSIPPPAKPFLRQRLPAARTRSTALPATSSSSSSGNQGSQVFNFKSGATGADMKAAINSVSDATGVTADFAANTLTLTSSGYGSKAFAASTSSAMTGAVREQPQRNRATLATTSQATVNGVDGQRRRQHAVGQYLDPRT